MKELLRDRGFQAAGLVSFLAMVLGFPFYQVELPLSSGSFLKFYQTALETQTMLFLIPVAAVLSPGAAYVRESSSGFLRLYLTRTSRMEYIRTKTWRIYAGGFLPFFLAGVLGFLLCFFFLYPLELTGSIPWEKIPEVLKILLRISFTGGILAECSGIFAAAFQNYYMACGLPFVTYYMMIILKERYLPELYALYPGEWVVCQQDWGRDNRGIWAFFLVISLAVMLIHSLILYRRLREI